MTNSKHGFVLTKLTSSKVTDVERSPSYKEVTIEDLEYFRSILPQESVLDPTTGNQDIYIKYSTDWYNIYRGSPAAILFPETTEQVSQLLAFCNEQRIAVVPQSGNTSASGGSVPVFDEVIISTIKMNKVRHFDDLKGDLVCDGGCVLNELDRYLEPFGYQIPLDLPSRHLCTLGGNINTNAGGIRQMRFGNLHGNVTGIECVLPDGTVIDNLTTLRKDNTGYHLKNLFIGSEGTLGIVTKVAITAARIRASINVFLFGFDTFDQVVRAYSRARKHLPETISAFEVMDHDSIECVARSRYVSRVSFPLPTSCQLYVIMETAGSEPHSEEKKAMAFTDELIDEGIAKYAVVAKSEKEVSDFWAWRTYLPRAIIENGPSSIHFDISLPLPLLYQLVTDTRLWAEEQKLIGTDLYAIFGYGHVGDGNMHLTIPAFRDDEELRTKIDDFVYAWTSRYKGSISAEHGVGLMKRRYLSYTKSSTAIASMRKIKQLFDPNAILNPYKVLPTDKEQNEGEVVRKRSSVGC